MLNPKKKDLSTSQILLLVLTISFIFLCTIRGFVEFVRDALNFLI